MKPPLFLFDLDGTLLHVDGAGRRAMQRAFEASFGSSEGLASLGFGGLTDRLIIRLAAGQQGREVDEATIDAVLASYLAYMAEECQRPSVFTPIEPARSTARALHARFPGHLGLGTGNAAAVAALKVEGIGLSGIFDFGGYGDDAEARAAMIQIGLNRGLSHLGLPKEATVPVVIGDTTRDVEAARRLELRVIAVATGSQDARVLSEAGADLTLDSLELDPVLRALAGWSS